MQPAPGFTNGPLCPTRRDLAEQFAIAARLYAETVVMFTRGTASGEEFGGLSNSEDEALARLTAARTAFKDHVSSHGC